MNRKSGWQVFIKQMLFSVPFLFSLSCSPIQKTTEIKENTLSESAETTPEKEIVVSEFILGVGDEVELTVYRHDDLNKKVRIPPDGANTFPLTS